MQDLIRDWFAQNKFERSYLPTIEGNLYFEGEWALRKLTNYTLLLLLATIIATYGVTSASTATVIGAMLVAPLMTPIMATTLALVRGDERRAAKSVALTVISVIAVIVLAMMLSLPIPFIDFEGNGEISSRVAPGLTAMGVALAAGAAGAFANSRKEIGDSLPGVAISISLVPPLSVVGIALAHGHYEDALGSLVLFITNFLAIVLAGSLVFWLSGANALNLKPTNRGTNAGAATLLPSAVHYCPAAVGGDECHRFPQQQGGAPDRNGPWRNGLATAPMKWSISLSSTPA